MQLTSKCTLLLWMFGICYPALPQVLQNPTIAIESRNATVESGQAVQVHIALENTTSQEFTIFRSTGGGSGELYCSISVIGPDGHPAASTEYGAALEKNRHAINPLSRKMVHVAPGETVDDNVTVSKMFNMAAPGTYLVQVSRSSPFDPAVILKSNTLEIDVVI